jgi:hypothetical protein
MARPQTGLPRVNPPPGGTNPGQPWVITHLWGPQSPIWSGTRSIAEVVRRTSGVGSVFDDLHEAADDEVCGSSKRAARSSFRLRFCASERA